MSAISAARPLALGVATGMRSQLGLAALAVAMRKGPRDVNTLVRKQVLASPVLKRTLLATAAGELVADKLPTTPSRLKRGPLLARLALGGVAGAVLGLAEEKSVLAAVTGAALGTMGAGIGAYGGYHLRAALDRHTNVPDKYWAVAEDITAIGLAAFAVAAGSPGTDVEPVEPD
ncbi:DUF4126 family protein [Catellatospora sp. KI3]|uniref:DUF4126 family protein n=1 Tax=Catellatospora sp. KI3 TaxID=3041620 RepID=UPI002482A113|nr:DUF4126 family protein [Catellatospora sp. KI3]MDI1463594.1 DUF4126 family protein [Catellatospora sp. KI3]